MNIFHNTELPCHRRIYATHQQLYFTAQDMMSAEAADSVEKQQSSCVVADVQFQLCSSVFNHQLGI